MECTLHIFGTHDENQDQTRVEDEVLVQVMIGDHLVERKWLKQVERKGLKEWIKVTHQVKSITWINQSSYFKWVSRMVLGERSLLPKCRGLPSMCR